jgi:hypothetical protein
MRKLFFTGLALAAFGLGSVAFAQNVASGSNSLRVNTPTNGALTEEDAPHQGGGVFRDYRVTLRGNSFLVVSVKSEEIDPMVEVYGPGNRKVGENDDMNGSTNSLLVAEIEDAGTYVIRVASYRGDEDQAYTGPFTVRVLEFPEP